MAKRVYVAGHRGMVGSAIVRQLNQVPGIELVTKTRKDLDLTDQSEVIKFFQNEKIDLVYLAAARVGGIHANSIYPADFLYENLQIEMNIIRGAHKADIQDLLFLGSSCIYPKLAEQPIKEECLLTGPLESTNEPYAIAKIAGIKLCESFNRQYGRDYRSVMPANLYGPNDNFHAENSHVIPALLRRFHEAKLGGLGDVSVWGSGRSYREFLQVDDLAAACVFVMNQPKHSFYSLVRHSGGHLNIGTGEDCSIKKLVELIQSVVEFNGETKFDTTKPDGTPRKVLDVSRLHALGWRHSINLEKGLKTTYEWFLSNQKLIRL